MNNLDTLKYTTFEDFSQKLQEINDALKFDKKYGGLERRGDLLAKVSTFIENHKELFQKEKQATLILSTLGAKVQFFAPGDPLISKLQYHLLQFPITLQFFRNTISNFSERIQAIADWIDLMKIPLVIV